MKEIYQFTHQEISGDYFSTQILKQHMIKILFLVKHTFYFRVDLFLGARSKSAVESKPITQSASG